MNTLGSDEKYADLTGENLTIPIPLQLSGQQKELFLSFLMYF